MKHSRPSFGREMRIGLFVLVGVLLVVAGWRWCMSFGEKSSSTSAEAKISAEELIEIKRFEQQRLADSSRRQEQRRAQWERWREAREKRATARDRRQADYEARRRQWAEEKALRSAERARRQARYDSLRRLRPEKLPAGSWVDLNSADTFLLQRIPGIGRGYARAIVGYRERMGGFVSPIQVLEIEGLPAGIDAWFRVEHLPNIRQIALNRATFKELLRHPYLNYDQVKAIVEHRRKRGDLRDWRDLGNSPHFSDFDFRRLQPYFRF